MLGTANAERLRERPNLRQYAYRKGKAIVFGSRFEHRSRPAHRMPSASITLTRIAPHHVSRSTEPGAGADGEAHAYLCFMFGTDEQAQWSDIAQTMDAQATLT